MDATLIYFVYRALQWAGLPFILIYFAARFLKDPRYLRRFGERLGFVPASFRQATPGAVWLHAVSVGEVLACMEMLRRLKAQLPRAPLFVSTSTLAGRALADQKLSGLADGVFFAPLDYCFAVRRVLRTLRPAVVVVAETEIWPNLYREVKRVDCGLVVVNGRISDSAAPRYLRFRWLFRRVLRWPDYILAQSEVNRQRFLALGAPEESTFDGGNLKYDFQPGKSAIPKVIENFLARTAPRQVWIAASTMPPAVAGDPDEDDVVIDAYQALAPTHPGLLLILVPRKPERFDVVAEKLEAAGIQFVRRSTLEEEGHRLKPVPQSLEGESQGPKPVPLVLLLDSIGELSSLFSLESVVFMGGSLASRGGHNILEAAFFGRAIVVGPHMENFAEIAAEFEAGGGCMSIPEPGGLAAAVGRLLDDGCLNRKLGDRAKQLAEARRGATDRAIAVIRDAHGSAVPCFRRVFPVHQTLWLLARLWQFGAALKMRIHSATREQLETPVVSVGGLSMGGTGKTPFALWLAEKLRKGGIRPAILTRGYRRQTPEPVTVLDANATVAVSRTGDEAQIFLRSRVGPVGISADRAASGRAIEQQFRPDVFLLDDGFQHWRLARSLDIVLLDSLDLFGGGEVFPLGRLREPPAALQRAGIIVITRTEPGRDYSGTEARIRKHNPHAPIHKARVVPERWVDWASGEQFPPENLPARKVAAFCGLANPASFWRTLRLLGLPPRAQWAFGDHHRYRPIEVRRLAAEARAEGVEALLTTEKDAMNLSAHLGELVNPLRVFYLRIGMEVEDGEGLVETVSQLAAKQA